MKKTTAALLLFTTTVFAQRNDTQAGLYNIGIGSLTGGIGAMINKKPTEKLGPVLVKGLWQGAIGGYALFESKRLIRLVHQNKELGFSWPSKIVNAAGTSIVENAAANRDFWERWHLNYGFSRFELDLKEHPRFHYKVMPIAFVYTVGVALQTKFELGKTLQTGQFIFSSNTKRWEETNSIGVAVPGNIIYKPGMESFYNVITHEIVHIYQFNDLNGINTYMDKPHAYLSSKSSFFKKIDKWIAFDYNTLVSTALYELENINAVRYYDNYFEHEAGYYSNTLDGQ